MKRILLQPAYVLHRRSYRETSYLVELFTQAHGRLTVIARGAGKRSSAQGLLQPFLPLLVSFAGKGELMSLIEVEANGAMKHLQGECLFAGFYLNELLMRLLQKWDAHADLYAIYENALSALQGDMLEEKTLRSFEKKLLEELGYGLLPKHNPHHVFVEEKFYRFIPEHGFTPCDEAHEGNTGNIFSGKNLLALAREDWQNEECLFDAKRLTRFVLAPLLGERPLYSRRLFMQPFLEKK
jgi:DNA repair protein RecO (recombination protein O)